MRRQVEIIQNIYEAFGRGDVPAILEHLAPDVIWEYGWTETPVPWLEPGRGRDHVSRFFRVLSEQLEITSFAVNHILPGDNLVVALVDVEGTAKATGKRIIEVDETHIWHFNERGQVSKFRHVVDTYQHAMALMP